MKILISNDLGVLDEDVEYLKSIGYYDIEFFDGNAESDAEVIVGKIKTDKEALAKYPNLKFLHILSAGFDSLDLDALKEKGITMANARGVFSKPIAEYILGKTLVWAKNDHLYYNQQKQKKWNRVDDETLELSGKVIGILGTGSIAQETARLFKAFDSKVLGVNTSGKAVEYFDETYAIKDMQKVLKESDVVVCTLPLNESTYHIMGKKEFLTMKENALFINIGRGKEVDEQGLLEVLDTHLSCIVMDVFEKEPLPENSPLWLHPKVIITPHSSSDSDLVSKREKKLVLENLDNYINNKEIKNRII